MNRKLPHFVVPFILLSLFSANGLAKTKIDCTRPETVPSVPDGRRSSEDEMKEAMSKVLDYLAANAAFRECLTNLVKENPEYTKQKALDAVQGLINDTLEMDAFLGELFNQQVRIHKSANHTD